MLGLVVVTFVVSDDARLSAMVSLRAARRPARNIEPSRGIGQVVVGVRVAAGFARGRLRRARLTYKVAQRRPGIPQHLR